MNLDVDKKDALKSILTVFALKFIHSIKTLFSANAIWKQTATDLSRGSNLNHATILHKSYE